MKRTIFLILFGALFQTVWVGGNQAAYALDAGKKYERCTSLTRTKPSLAYKMANEWLRKENTASAYHCRALSLFALKRYAEAGKELDQLSTQLGKDNLPLWASVLQQSSKAWMLAGDKERAITSLSDALDKLAAENDGSRESSDIATDMLIERSELYAATNEKLLALQDLDHAVSLSPQKLSAWLARGSLLHKMGQSALAAEDVARVLKAEPRNSKAQKLAAAIKAAPAKKK